MSMTFSQMLLTVIAVVLGTMLTRFLPFILFRSDKPTPKYVEYLGKVLPAAVFGMLVVYSFKNVDLLSGSHGIPELIAVVVTALLHIWKRQTLLSIAGGTIVYMVLVQVVFKLKLCGALPHSPLKDFLKKVLKNPKNFKTRENIVFRCVFSFLGLTKKTFYVIISLLHKT